MVCSLTLFRMNDVREKTCGMATPVHSQDTKFGLAINMWYAQLSFHAIFLGVKDFRHGFSVTHGGPLPSMSHLGMGHVCCAYLELPIA